MPISPHHTLTLTHSRLGPPPPFPASSDKSFLATIALAAASSPAGVVLGAIAGHGVATALAVAGGGALKGVVSERTVQYVGGSLFLVFAAATLVDIVRGV